MDTLKKYCLELAIRATQVIPSAASTAAAINIVEIARVFEDYLSSDKEPVIEEKSEQSTLKFGSFKEFLDYLDKMK